MQAHTFSGLTVDLFCRICLHCGWATARTFCRISSLHRHYWTRLPTKFFLALQPRILIIGTVTTKYDTWDRLTLWSEFRRHKQLSLPVPRPRSNPAIVFDGTRHIYILGGANNRTDDVGQRHASGVAVDSFELENLRWHTHPEMVTERLDSGAGYVSKEVIVMAGVNADGDVLKSIDVFEIDHSSWQTRHSLEFARFNFALATIGSNIFVIGGLNGIGAIVPTIEVVSEGGTMIRTLTNVPEPVAGSMATSVGYKIVLIGGQIGPMLAHSARVQEFDTATSTWTELAVAPMEISNGLYFQTPTRIHIFGGQQTEGVANDTDDVEAIMNYDEGKWMHRRSHWGIGFGVALWLNSSYVTID